MYWFYSRGLIYELRARDEVVTLDEMTAESEAILATYHMPRHGELAGPYRAWERLTLVDSAQGCYRVGKEYEIAGDSLRTKDPGWAGELYRGARSWYLRALEVYPRLAEAKQGLERLLR